METKFTKGPWVARTELFGDLKTALIYVDGGGFDISGSPNCMANAHLIAAAPEMYEAIVELIELYESGLSEYGEAIGLDNVQTRKFKELLAKARGEHGN